MGTSHVFCDCSTLLWNLVPAKGGMANPQGAGAVRPRGLWPLVLQPAVPPPGRCLGRRRLSIPGRWGLGAVHVGFSGIPRVWGGRVKVTFRCVSGTG